MTELINEHLTRQADLIPEESLITPITIIGAGAIGSWTALSLAKMGFENITVWDHDEVEPVNQCAQIYGRQDTKDPKVDALAYWVYELSDVKIKTHQARFDFKEQPEGVLVVAVDSMRARKEIFESQTRNVKLKLLIDARMAIETLCIYSYKPLDARSAEMYLTTLFSDEEAIQERCTMRAVAYTSLLASGFVSKLVTRAIIQREWVPSFVLDVKTMETERFKVCKL